MRNNIGVYRRADPFLFGEITYVGPVTCSITGKQYEELLRNHVLLASQQCVDRTIFMKDGVPPHIATRVKQLLSTNFGDDTIISYNFLHHGCRFPST